MPEPTLRAQKTRLRLLAAAGVLLLFAAWAAASMAAGSFFVPAPWTTAADTARLLALASTWTQILITFLRVLVGFAAGFAAGNTGVSQAMVFTLIAIEAVVAAVALALVILVKRTTGSLDSTMAGSAGKGAS